jgi:hypothetical protein
LECSEEIPERKKAVYAPRLGYVHRGGPTTTPTPRHDVTTRGQKLLFHTKEISKQQIDADFKGAPDAQKAHTHTPPHGAAREREAHR